MITKISIDKAFAIPNAVWIDGRSPKEYETDHIANALNLPLLNDEERHEIGIIYKQISREEAIEKGLAYYSNKIPTIISTVRPLWDKNIIIYCARGGMRSGIIASLLDSIGFKVYQIEGGYKAFRNYMVKELYQCIPQPKVIVLWGLTCSGKTALLQHLSNSLDLEGLAQHRGSLIGHLGLQPHSQKKFENLLLQRLRELDNEKVIFIEGESRRIGDIIIPDNLYKAMLHGTNILITRSLEKRAEAMAEEYFKEEFIEEIKEVIKGLRRLISNKRKEELIHLLDQRKTVDAAKILLEDYYDPLYQHTLQEITFFHEVNTDEITKAIEELQKIF